jgi:hypothetical protein
VTDEEFVYELSQHDAETILATLEGTFGSLEETPQHILDAVEATGRVEFEYDEGEEPDGWEELSQQVSAIEDYLSSVPREQWAPSQGYEYDPSPEEAEAILIEHVNDEMDVLEEALGRELPEAEIARTTQSVLDLAQGGEIPSVADAYEVGKWDHEERTSTRQGRQTEMVEQLQAQNYQEPSQEDVDELAEQDDNRSRTQLMMHALDGTVSLNGGSESEAEWHDEP